MQNINRLWQIFSMTSAFNNLMQQTRRYHFAVTDSITFYLHTDGADVTISRWPRPIIEITAGVRGAFGYRILTDQDEAGVYIASKRKPVLGRVSTARLRVFVPNDAHLMLKVEGGTLSLKGMSDRIELEPRLQVLPSLDAPVTAQIPANTETQT